MAPSPSPRPPASSAPPRSPTGSPTASTRAPRPPSLSPSSSGGPRTTSPRAGFVEYLTLQNPGLVAGVATITYQAADDTGTPVAIVPQTMPVPARSRITVNVARYVDDLGVTAPINVSARVASTVPLVAERP